MSETSPLRALLIPSAVGLIALCAFLDTALSGRAAVMLSADLPTHIVFGEWMIDEERLIAADHTNFALPPGKHYIDHEWLSQLALAVAYRSGGLAGVVLLAAALLAAIFAVLGRILRRRGVSPILTIAVAWGAFQFAQCHLLIRPHLLSWLLGLLWLDWLDRYRSGELTRKALLWRTGPTIFLWANCHAGFLLGFFLLALHGLGAIAERVWERVRELAGLGAALAFISLFNPYGWDLHLHFVGLLANTELQGPIDEWRSPNFSASLYKLPLLLWLGALLMMLRGKRPSWTEAIVFLGLSYSALKMQRNVAVLGLLVAPAIGERLQAALGVNAFDAADRRNHGFVTLALVAFLAAPNVVVDYPAKHFPVEAARFVEAHPQQFTGRMYNVYEWGGYLSQRLKRPVLINGLNDHYGVQHYRNYRSVYALKPGWEAVLDRLEIRWIIYHSNTPLCAMLDASPGWTRVHKDRLATIYVRR